jgi:hypothetical protein
MLAISNVSEIISLVTNILTMENKIKLLKTSDYVLFINNYGLAARNNPNPDGELYIANLWCYPITMSYANATIGWTGPSTKLRTGAHQILRTSERRSSEQRQSLARAEMRWHLPIWILLLPFLVNGQENLVPNPSFEEYSQCPTQNGGYQFVDHWEAVYGGGGVNFFHECGNYSYGIPANFVGGGYARTGQAYMGFAAWGRHSGLHAQFPGVPLKEPLVEGRRYRAVFHVSLNDSFCVAIRNMGAYFSATQPPANIDSLDSYEPQVRWQSDSFLTDKQGWTEVSGIFIAQGGEQFLTIGNFDGHYGTDTLNVGNCGQPKPWNPDYWNSSGYYIDDVSVIDMDSLTGVDEMEGLAMNVYPNPAKNFFTIETGQGNGTLSLYDGAGRQVLSILLQSSKQNISVVGIPAGVYVAVVEQKGKAAARRKLVIE